MKRFALGFLTGAAVLVLGVVGYLHFGLANVAADTPIPEWQTGWELSSRSRLDSPHRPVRLEESASAQRRRYDRWR